METTAVATEHEVFSDRGVLAVPSKDYAGLDVFGTEALESVCGINILDPFYRFDVKRVIVLWCVLLLAATAALTAAFFGCFRRIKGENVDLSRNLWNEDLFWTSLVSYMLACSAVTCGLSALASHTNLYSHTKVLGFRRMFRWCLALHGAAATFTLVVALKLSVVDLFESKNGMSLNTKKAPPHAVVDEGVVTSPKHVYVYPRPFYMRTLGSSSLPSPMAPSFMEKTTSVNAKLQRVTGKVNKMEATSSAGMTTKMPALSFPKVTSSPHPTAALYYLQQIPGPGTTTTKTLHEAPVDPPLYRQKLLKKTDPLQEQGWKLSDEISQVALFHKSASLRNKLKACASPSLRQQNKCEKHTRETPTSDRGDHAYTETPIFYFGKKGGSELGPATSGQVSVAAGKHFCNSRVNKSSFLQVLPQCEFPQDRPRGILLPNFRRSAPIAERRIQPPVQLTRSTEGIYTALNAQKPLLTTYHMNGAVDKRVLLLKKLSSLPMIGISKRRRGRTDTRGPTSDGQHRDAAASFFFESVSRESRTSDDPLASAEVHNEELRPLRESHIYRIMLCLVVGIDCLTAVLHSVCSVYTWRLAAKIGGMFGLKILKIPF